MSETTVRQSAHKALAENRQSPLKRCGFVRLVLQQRGDSAQFRVHARRQHHGSGLARGNHGPHEQHVAAVGQGRVTGEHRPRVLFDRCRFARERRFQRLQAESVEKSRVGGNMVPRLHLDTVADDERRAGMVFTSPSRNALAVGAESFWSALKARSAFRC